MLRVSVLQCIGWGAYGKYVFVLTVPQIVGSPLLRSGDSGQSREGGLW